MSASLSEANLSKQLVTTNDRLSLVSWLFIEDPSNAHLFDSTVQAQTRQQYTSNVNNTKLFFSNIKRLIQEGNSLEFQTKETKQNLSKYSTLSEISVLLPTNTTRCVWPVAYQNTVISFLYNVCEIIKIKNNIFVMHINQCANDD